VPVHLLGHFILVAAAIAQHREDNQPLDEQKDGNSQQQGRIEQVADSVYRRTARRRPVRQRDIRRNSPQEHGPYYCEQPPDESDFPHAMLHLLHPRRTAIITICMIFITKHRPATFRFQETPRFSAAAIGQAHSGKSSPGSRRMGGEVTRVSLAVVFDHESILYASVSKITGQCGLFTLFFLTTSQSSLRPLITRQYSAQQCLCKNIK